MDLRKLKALADNEQNKLYEALRSSPDIRRVYLRPDVDFARNGVKVCERKLDLEMSPEKTLTAYAIVYETLTGKIEKEVKIVSNNDGRKEISCRMPNKDELPIGYILDVVRVNKW